MGINYDNYTIRLRDPGIRNKNPYVASLGPAPHSKLTFDHVIYLKCSDPVRDDAGYVDTAACVDWRSNGGEGDHVYAVVGDLEAGRFKPECRVKSVATIGSDWRSFLKGKSFSYGDIHGLLSLGFELSWWEQACLDHHCAKYEHCFFNDSSTQKVSCSENTASCYSSDGVSFPLFCGNMANLNHRVEAFLVGILAGLPSSKDIRERNCNPELSYSH